MTTNPKHFSAPQTGLRDGGGPARRMTSRHKRGALTIARLSKPFGAIATVDREASRDCAVGALRPAAPGRFRITFPDREMEALWAERARDPNRRLVPATLYAVSGAGSTGCTIWRLTP